MSASEGRRWGLRPAHGVALLGAAVAIFAYPAILDRFARDFGPRSTAIALVAIGLGTALASRKPLRATLGLGVAPGLGIVVLATIAALADDALALRLVPAWVQAILFYVFATSLRAAPSLIERMARTLEPAAPDFIAPYCRRVTVFWSILFALNTAVLAGLAIFAPVAVWRSVASAWIWLPMAGSLVVEFFIRKSYFRYYWYQGPFDRLWAQFFPAESTPMGRRSAAYIAKMRAELPVGEDPHP